MSEGKKNGEENKGFAGLTSLLSDVDASVNIRKTSEPARAEPSPAAPTAPLSTAKSQSPTKVSSSAGQGREGTYQSPPQTGGGGSGGKWILGLGVAGLVIWGLTQMADKGPATSGSDYSPPATTTSPTTSRQPSYTPSPPSPAPRLVEEMPGAGSGNVLGTGQIRYCLAEDIRLTAAKEAAKTYNNNDVDRFNAMVADYNSRCSNFRYRRGALESARSEVDRYRTDLEKQGRARFARAISPPAARKSLVPPPSIPTTLDQDVGQTLTPPIKQRTPNYKSGSQCTYSTECSGSNQCLDGQCRPPRVSGERCTYSAECAGANQCLDGQCRAARTGGERCTYSSECSGANQCLDGQCRPARTGGERCTFSSECSGANQCLDGQCRPPRVAGERCAFSAECGGINECIQSRCQRPQ